MNKDSQQILRHKLDELRRDLPIRRREVTDILRLVDLAKQSPRAALSQGFLDRVEQTWTFRMRDIEMMEKMAEEIEKILVLPNTPPETPNPLKPVS